MPNKAINQLPFASNRRSGDVIYIVRSGADYKLDVDNMAPPILTAQVLIPSADVLTLNGTPVQIIPAADAGTVIVPMRGIIEFSGGSSDYATNTTLAIGSTTTLGDSTYTLSGSIADRTVPNLLTVTSNTLAGTVPGDSLSARVNTGNPTTGDSDVTITVWYYILPV